MVLGSTESGSDGFFVRFRAACRARAFLLEQLREQYFEFGRACFSQPFQEQQWVPTWGLTLADACFAGVVAFALAVLALEAEGEAECV